MSRYKYVIVRMDEELSISIEVDVPLPHLTVGNSLIVVNQHLAVRGGCHLIIRHIETTLSAVSPPDAHLVSIAVYVEERDRAATPGIS
jgi:hypothetical protein